MSQHVVLLLGESPHAPLTWLRIGDDGGLLARGRSDSFGDFATSSSVSIDAPVTALLPGELVALRLLPAPPRGQAQFLSAAGYLLEDSLAEDIDNLHVAVAKRGGSGLCLALSDTIIKAWAQAFSEYQLTPDLMTADFLGLPLHAPSAPQIHVDEAVSISEDEEPKNLGANDEDTHLSLFFHQDGLLAHGSKGGVSMDRDTAEIVLEAMIDEWSPTYIDLYAEKIPDFLKDRPGLTTHDGADLSVLASLIGKALNNKSAMPNLISGAYGRKTDWKALIAPWRGVGIAAALCLFALGANWIAEGWRNDREIARLAALTNDIHASAFPAASGEDPVAYARRVLSARGGGTDFQSLWVGFSGAVDNRQGIQIEHFRYVNGGRTLQVGILVDTLQTLSELRAALEENGIQTRQSAMTRTSSGLFSGELTVGR